MQKLLAAVPVWTWLVLVVIILVAGYMAAIPVWAWLVLGGVILVAGYTIGSFVIGFGTRTVKTVTTFEYEGADASIGAPEGQPTKRSTTTEVESYKTFWDWLTLLTISAVIAIVALQFTRSQAEKQEYIQFRGNVPHQPIELCVQLGDLC